MIFQVRFQPAAVEDLDAAYCYAAAQAPDAAIRWLHRFEKALQTLDRNPERCPLARENARSDKTLREFLFGRKPNVFRVVFTVDREHETVWILRIRRGQQRGLTGPELDKP